MWFRCYEGAGVWRDAWLDPHAIIGAVDRESVDRKRVCTLLMSSGQAVVVKGTADGVTTRIAEEE